jgi:hypothetical protein
MKIPIRSNQEDFTRCHASDRGRTIGKKLSTLRDLNLHSCSRKTTAHGLGYIAVDVRRATLISGDLWRAHRGEMPNVS